MMETDTLPDLEPRAPPNPNYELLKGGKGYTLAPHVLALGLQKLEETVFRTCLTRCPQK